MANEHDPISFNNEDKTCVFGKKVIEAPLCIETINEVVRELGIVQLTWPTIVEPEFESRTCFPESYYKNSNKEKLLLAYTENFRQQIFTRYPNKKPLLLQALNECGLQKMVCTTLRPTRIPFPELLTWKGCASFVSDYFMYEPLKTFIILPERIMSPVTVLKRRKGNCFELASVLVSLLCGAGYHSYVVVGRATRDITLSIQCRTECPLQDVIEEDTENPPTEQKSKYKVNPATEFKSLHLLRQEEQRKHALMQMKNIQERENAKRIEELEKPPFDEIHGWRLHSWVLILPAVNTKDQDVPFYIEPATGCKYDISYSGYLSVECIYNHENYYVNLKDDVPNSFHISDTNSWASLLCMEHKSSLNSMEDCDLMVEKHLDMPSSWVEKFELTNTDIEQRYPNGEKTIKYKKAILEKYALYSRKDGLVKKITYFEDYDYKIPLNWNEWYKYRSDFLSQVAYNHLTKNITEFFLSGRNDFLRRNKYEIDCKSDSFKCNRTMEFFSKCHPDNLAKIITSPFSICEYYVDCEDRLRLRKILYEEIKTNDNFSKKVVYIKKYFDRDHNIPPCENIAEEHYYFMDNKVTLVYHYDINSIIKSMRSFIIPNTTETSGILTFDPELISEINITKKLNNLQMYKILCKCADDMCKAQKHVQKIESQLLSILNTRIDEINKPSMIIPLFFSERNESGKEGLAKKEMHERNLQERDKGEIGMWPGAPYMIREGCTVPTLSSKYQCLEDFRSTQVLRQNKLQAKYDEYVARLKNEHQWYITNRLTVTTKDETEYFNRSCNLSFEIQALEVQLRRNCDLSETRYTHLLNILQIDDN